MSALNNESNNNNTINTNFTNQVQLDISNNQEGDDPKVTYAIMRDICPPLSQDYIERPAPRPPAKHESTS
jgi:hypothetical protein